jgi:transcriptional regulator with XRE-family HTH domain
MNDAPQLVPIRLEIIRRRANITQGALAEAARCTQATISNLERRVTKDPSLEFLSQIMVALGKLGADMSQVPSGASLLEAWSG